MSLVVSSFCFCVLFLSCTIWFRELHITHRVQQNIRQCSLVPFLKTQASHVLIF
ncbi:hypothetical protein ES332_D11G217200v1 [Gossypium tomentosum]|uniref:Uncharacterized protein n=1 Tax=Gossypium tomentosum TaxID=34277 RepID=A0A5D2IR32_GOSTO|nr:hypothetical protein ES332_D11G217200v1 [Gossypium tomentosum]